MSFSPKVGGSGTSYLTPASSNSYLTPASSTKEYSLKVPKITEVKHQIIKFNSNLNIDFVKWAHAKMERDIKKADNKTEDGDMPKFGAGSEFGREARQEARKKRYGGNKKVSESSPWLLKVGGKKFRGIREGGITDNSSYYLFTHGDDGVINAQKLEEWYNFQPIQRYKTLTVEEAEEEFGRRNKVMNHFTVMLQKRLKNDEEEEIDDEDKTKGKKRIQISKKELKISEIEEWEASDEDSGNSDESNNEQIEKKKKEKQKTKTKAKQKKKSKGSDESAMEDSDDGDEEERELDYISDSSDNVSDDDAKAFKEMQGVSEEKALKSLLTSDEDDEDEDEVKDGEKKPINDETEEKNKNDENKLKLVSPNKKKKKSSDKKITKDSDSESDSSLDSSDIDIEPIRKRPFSLDGMKMNSDPNGFSNDLSSQSLEPAHKKARLEFSPVTISDTHGITEDAVRRYLSRKPITTTQLVTKFKNRSNLSSEQLVSIIALLLKKINPEKKMIKNKMFLSLKHS